MHKTGTGIFKHLRTFGKDTAQRGAQEGLESPVGPNPITVLCLSFHQCSDAAMGKPLNSLFGGLQGMLYHSVAENT